MPSPKMGNPLPILVHRNLFKDLNIKLHLIKKFILRIFHPNVNVGSFLGGSLAA